MRPNYIQGMHLSTLCLLGLLATGAPAEALAQGGPVTSGLVLWLKADSGLSSDGTTWADHSGKSHDATALAGQAPAYVPDGLNGLPVAEFKGNQAMSIADQLLHTQQFTIVAVASDASESGTQGFREIMSNWSSPTSLQSIFLGTIWHADGSKDRDRIRFTDAIGGADEGQTGRGKIRKPSKAFILTASSGASKACIYLGAKKEYCLEGGLPARDLSPSWMIGRQGTLSSEYWVGDIAEILVYKNALTASERDADVSYLSAKWGVQAQ